MQVPIKIYLIEWKNDFNTTKTKLAQTEAPTEKFIPMMGLRIFNLKSAYSASSLE